MVIFFKVKNKKFGNFAELFFLYVTGIKFRQ